MSLERLLVPIYVPRWMHRAAVRFKRAFIPPARNGDGCQVTQAFTEQFSQFKEQSRWMADLNQYKRIGFLS